MKRFDSMNVIPLIDVMLVLLAIVLITASFIVHDSIKLDLPDTESTESYMPSDEKSIFLALDKTGQLFLDDKPIELTDFKTQAISFNKQDQIVVKIDESTKFGDFVKVVDILKLNKLTNLTFLTEKVK